ncbi:MAG: hypothetical protein AB8B78_09315 [Polaribacter sp.]
MESNSIEKKFLDFEKSNSLFEFEIQGIKIWDFIRYKTLEDIKKKKARTIYSNSRSKKKYMFSLLFKQFIKILLNFNKYTIKSKSDFLFLNHPRRIHFNDFYEDIYTDDIIDKLNEDNYKTLTIEMPINFSHLKPSKTKKIKYLDILDLGSGFSNYLFWYNLSKEEKESIKFYKKEIKRIFLVDIDLIKAFTNSLRKYKFLYPRVNKIIKKVNPRCLVSVDAYSIEKKMFIRSASQSNIPTIELQHGAIGFDHIAYYYNKDLTTDTFPKYLFVWGESWQKCIKLPVNAKSIITGFPYMQKKQKIKRDKTYDSENNILVISQWTIGLELISFINKLALIQKTYNFHYKLHPLEFEEKEHYKSLVETTNIKIYSDEKDTYDFFDFCSIQIGVHSTLLFEGAAFNLKTFVVPLSGYRSIMAVPDSGFILLKTIYHFDKIKYESTINNSLVNPLWKDNALENTIKEIKKIINL